MLLDIHAIKVALLNLPGSESTASYTKLVNKQMLHLETLLKVLLSSATPPDGLIQNYLYLIRDKNTVNFIKVLDMKGVPKYQQQPILNTFITTLQSYEGELMDRNPLLGNLNLVDPRTSDDGSRKLDPSSFFRDQLGIGASQPVSRANTPAPERFGSHIGRIFSKRTVSGMNLSSIPGQ